MKRKIGISLLFITVLICMYCLPAYCYNIFNLVGCKFSGGSLTWFAHDIEKCDIYDFPADFALELGNFVTKDAKSRKYTFTCHKLDYILHMIRCTHRGNSYLVGFKKDRGEIVYIEPLDETFSLYGKVKKGDLKSGINFNYNIYELDSFTQIAYGFPENWGCTLWFNRDRKWVINNFYQTSLELPKKSTNHAWTWLSQKIYSASIVVPYYIFYPMLLSFVYLIFSSINERVYRKKIALTVFGIIFVFIMTSIIYITMYEHYYGSI